MAKGIKTGGRNFKPGVSGNPLGAVPVPAELKAARKLTRIELERILNQYLAMTRAEIMDAAKRQDTPVLELMIAQIIAKGVNDGDFKRISFILDRLGFVVTQKVEVAGSGGGPLSVLYTEEQKRKIAKAFLDE